jgi:hypothetical protein
MESVYHNVTIRVNETSWAHIWRLRSRYLGMAYDTQVLENLGMPPILGIPCDPRTASDALVAVDVILKHVKEAYDSSHDPWDSALGAFCHHQLRHRCPPCNSILCIFSFVIYSRDMVLFVPSSLGLSPLFPTIIGDYVQCRQYFACPAII